MAIIKAEVCSECGRQTRSLAFFLNTSHCAYCLTMVKSYARSSNYPQGLPLVLPFGTGHFIVRKPMQVASPNYLPQRGVSCLIALPAIIGRSFHPSLRVRFTKNESSTISGKDCDDIAWLSTIRAHPNMAKCGDIVKQFPVNARVFCFEKVRREYLLRYPGLRTQQSSRS